jgi:predicted nucleic acid-binding protein
VSIYYLDASALVKRYVHETGSVWLRSLFSSPQAELLFTSRMTIVEVISAFARRFREDALTSAAFSAAENAFRSDCSHDYQIMPPSLEIVDLACSLLRRHPLRAYDAPLGAYFPPSFFSPSFALWIRFGSLLSSSTFLKSAMASALSLRAACAAPLMQYATSY